MIEEEPRRLFAAYHLGRVQGIIHLWQTKNFSDSKALIAIKDILKDYSNEQKIEKVDKRLRKL